MQNHVQAQEKICEYLQSTFLRALALSNGLEGQALSDPTTKRRELNGLLEALNRFSLKEDYILTEDEEAVLVIEKDKVKYKIIILPIWKWLLNFEE